MSKILKPCFNRAQVDNIKTQTGRNYKDFDELLKTIHNGFFYKIAHEKRPDHEAYNVDCGKLTIAIRRSPPMPSQGPGHVAAIMEPDTGCRLVFYGQVCKENFGDLYSCIVSKDAPVKDFQRIKEKLRGFIEEKRALSPEDLSKWANDSFTGPAGRKISLGRQCRYIVPVP